MAFIREKNDKNKNSKNFYSHFYVGKEAKLNKLENINKNNYAIKKRSTKKFRTNI